MITSDKTKRGIIIAVAVLAGLTSFWLSALLLLVAGVLIAWGQEPQRTEEFIGSLPYGDKVLKGLAQVDAILSAIR
jgi:hypothetical protein